MITLVEILNLLFQSKALLFKMIRMRYSTTHTLLYLPDPALLQPSLECPERTPIRNKDSNPDGLQIILIFQQISNYILKTIRHTNTSTLSKMFSASCCYHCRNCLRNYPNKESYPQFAHTFLSRK